MDIQGFTLIAVELIQPLKTVSIKGGLNNWECTPKYTLGNNSEGKFIQNIDVTILRNKNTHQGTIMTRTSFLLNLASKEYKPTTDKDFEVYTFFATLAIAHARTFFIIEAKGSVFVGDILPADYTDGIRNKFVLALNINTN